jgi:hypothetical protein
MVVCGPRCGCNAFGVRVISFEPSADPGALRLLNSGLRTKRFGPLNQLGYQIMMFMVVFFLLLKLTIMKSIQGMVICALNPGQCWIEDRSGQGQRDHPRRGANLSGIRYPTAMVESRSEEGRARDYPALGVSLLPA